MTVDTAEVEATLVEVKEHWAARRHTVRQLARFLGISQVEIADRIHVSRQTMNQRLNGQTQFGPQEIAAIALILGVPRHVMDMSPNDAVRWVLDHPEEFPDIRWSSRNPLGMAS